jgi:putative hydrolase of the HAD superfamily
MSTRDEHLMIIRQYSRHMEPLPTGASAALRPLRDIEAVLFDVYGTLFVSSSGELGASGDASHADAFCPALQDVGLSLRTDGAEGVRCLHSTIQDFHSRSRQDGIDFPEVDIVEVWRATLDSLRQRGVLGGLGSAVDLAMLSLRYELLTNPVWPTPGAAQCLTELASRGVRLGLVSNGQWFTPLLFPALLGGEPEALGVAPDMQFWSFRAGRAKPSEYLFRQASEALRARGIGPHRVLYVGNDMLHDVLPAAAMGFRTALFAGDRRSLRRREGDARVASVTPDVVVLQLRDLLSCVRPSQDL